MKNIGQEITNGFVIVLVTGFVVMGIATLIKEYFIL